MIDSKECDHICSFMKSLGHPVRLKMVEMLMSDHSCSVTDLADGLGLPQSTASQHLGILRNNGIIQAKKDGVITCYQVVHEKVKVIMKILKD